MGKDTKLSDIKTATETWFQKAGLSFRVEDDVTGKMTTYTITKTGATEVITLDETISDKFFSDILGMVDSSVAVVVVDEPSFESGL